MQYLNVCKVQIINVTGLGTNTFGVVDGSGIAIKERLNNTETVLAFIFCYTVLGATSEKKKIHMDSYWFLH